MVGAGVVGAGGVLGPEVRESCSALPPRLWFLVLIPSPPSGSNPRSFDLAPLSFSLCITSFYVEPCNGPFSSIASKSLLDN